MKKIILTLLLLLNTYNMIVSAETIYSDYYMIDSIDEFILDENKIESYKIYNTYKIEYEDLGYIKDNGLYLKDENDFIYNKNEYNVLINTSSSNKSINMLRIEDLNMNFKIYELEIYSNDVKIDYTINNIDDFYEKETAIYLFDNNINTYYLYRKCPLSIEVNLQNDYDIENLKLVFYTEKNNVKTAFKINIDDKSKIYLNKSNHNKHIIKFKINDDNIGLIEYFYDDGIKLYKHYKENKIIENNYIKDGENIILDDYKIVNKYYKRDKLVLKDDLIITNNMVINDLIEYSSNKIKFDCNINYEENGIYKCKFILNDKIIEKDIIVDIKEENEISNNINSNTNSVENDDEIKETNIKEDKIKKEFEKEVNKDIFENEITQEPGTNEMSDKTDYIKDNGIKHEVVDTISISKEKIKKNDKNIKNIVSIKELETKNVKEKRIINAEKKDYIIKKENSNKNKIKKIIKIICIIYLILLSFVTLLFKKKKK